MPPGGHVLAVGCGPGVALGPLARQLAPATLTGIDINREDVATAHSLGGSARVLEADVGALPFADACFDVVIDFGTCHHLSEQLAGMAEITRVVKPGGLFVHETALAQALAHPFRFRRRESPWGAVPELVAQRRAGLWTSRTRV